MLHFVYCATLERRSRYAALLGDHLYLGAYAQRLGASGLTFFDDEVTEFFAPHSAGKSVMFLVALGYADRAALGLKT